MNADVFKGKWLEIKGDVKRRWGKLTDNEVEEIAGTEEMLIGLLQKSYGYAREDAERDYEEFMTALQKGERRDEERGRK
jgi:uncharacterized protein YjbJ (UPF0337 family)